jgi:hypothetical protein
MSNMEDDKQDQEEVGVEDTTLALSDGANDEEASSNNPEEPSMVKWRGHYVSEREAKILKHVFDEMKDHFGNRKCEHPHIRFNCDPSLFLSKNEPYTYRSHPDPVPEDRWHGEVDFTYTIDEETYNMDYIAIDVSHV